MPESKPKAKIQKPKVTKEVKKAAKSNVAKKVVSTKPVASKIVEPKTTGLTVKMFDTTGKAAGTIKLPENVFGAKINVALLKQALHIYFANSKTHLAHTKTRAEVRGGGRKPWRQKGTGNARAGSIRSPLWVGGGTAFGPRTRNVKLDLSKKMKQKALISALSQKAKSGEVKIISNLEKLGPKTKIMANLLSKIEAKNPVLIISIDKKNVQFASRNIPKTTTQTPENLNAYEIIRHRELIISKEALTKFKS